MILKRFEMMERAYRYIRRNPKIMAALLIVLLLLTCISGSTFAKYVKSKEQSALAEAAGFYFSSDFLTKDWKTYNVYDWSDGIKIKLFNHRNGNASSMDINYTLTIVGGTISGNEIVTGTIASNKSEAELTIVPDSGIGSSVMVSVTTAPYEETLSATFQLEDAGGEAFYSFTDNGYYCILLIRTGDADISNLSIHYGSGLAPDNTDENTETWVAGPGDGALTNLKANSTYRFTFFDTGNVPHTSSSNIFEDQIIIQ